ncbi:hsp90 co-chaperone Cdc37, partial [Coemansia spiralis]
MPIDYSKWDNLELSDDSDVEVHPNIERGTFIRLRQRKIREDREKRRMRQERAEALVAMNKDLVQRITELRDEVSAADSAAMAAIASQWEQDVEQSRAFTQKRDAAIKEGAEPEQPSEAEMLAALKARISDDLLKAAASLDTPEAKRNEYVVQLGVHIGKLGKSLQDAEQELEEATSDLARHIDPESIAHGGFDRTFVSKASEASGSGSKGPAGSARRTEKQTVTADEVLNPGSVGRFDSATAAGAAEVEDEDDSNAIDENGDLRLDAD